MTELARVSVEDHDELRIVSIAGEIDTSNAAEVQQRAIEDLANTVLGVVVDLTPLRYLDSAGVGMVFEIGARLARRGIALVLVVPPNAPVRRTLEVTELHSAVALESTVDAAIAQALRGGSVDC